MEVTKDGLRNMLAQDLDILCREYLSFRTSGVLDPVKAPTIANTVLPAWDALPAPKPFGNFALWLGFALGDAAIVAVAACDETKAAVS